MTSEVTALSGFTFIPQPIHHASSLLNSTPDMFQSGFCLLPSSCSHLVKFQKPLGRAELTLHSCPFLICFLIHSSDGNFLDCHSLLPRPSVGHIWLTHWLSTPVHSGTSLMPLVPFDLTSCVALTRRPKLHPPPTPSSRLISF